MSTLFEALTGLQVQIGRWNDETFPDDTADDKFTGIVEEVGELAHAKLKMKEGIRVKEDHAAKEKDAVGDIVVFLIGYCHKRKISFAQCVSDAWTEASKRTRKDFEQL